MTDLFDQPLAFADPAARGAWNATAMAFLAHGASAPTHLGELLIHAPEAAGPQALKSLFLYLLGRRETVAQARDALARARRFGPSDPREAALIEAAGHALAGNATRAVEALERWLATHPGDMLLLKLSHAIRFTLGDAAGMRASLDRAAGAYGDDHPGTGYFLGCRAFALEETGDYAAAQAAGRAALERAPDDAWGLHAVAHVHDMTGNAEGGLDWLSGREAAWSHCNNFRFHVWWHKALMLVDTGALDAALALYDAQVRAERTDDWRDISNATSLLMRLELEGMGVGDRWVELADLCEKRTEDGCLIFADLHYLLALTGGRREAATARMMGRLARDAAEERNETQARMAVPGMDAAAGLEAFGDGQWSFAFDALRAARSDLRLAGGSHAQRDVFQRMCIDAGLRAGRLDEAEGVLLDRTRQRGHLDAYASVRHDLIAQARREACAALPAAE
ncbi:tetratricopeptide repeat protein [Jannaschia sp. Os4]|uniref:tetratricopeptide repeat protein n=1 Tax=Jannaschia sp. Os4 TaxID=2807617 RepID=UPI00193ABAFC|nr:tetratricopeptide repeat protein [Jannaschia sp. Os4]MBM2576575.1 tetratricopeptide repeat protein [Jannaschia sp. Os4]